jgi:hypothetical protein
VIRPGASPAPVGLCCVDYMPGSRKRVVVQPFRVGKRLPVSVAAVRDAIFLADLAHQASDPPAIAFIIFAEMVFGDLAAADEFYTERAGRDGWFHGRSPCYERQRI